MSDPGEIEVPGRGELARVSVDRVEEHGDWVAFEYEGDFGRQTQGILVRWDEKLVAFENVCPHLGLPLDTHSGRIFDISGSALLCDSHGARFDPEDGLCTMGPCEGDRLTELSVKVEEGEAVVSRRTNVSI